MIVLDASVVVELLVKGVLSDAIATELAQLQESFIVPHLIDVEVVSALRRMAAGKRLDIPYTEHLLERLRTFPAERYAHTPLLDRIWELRRNFTAYDAAYIALAEVTDSVLFTCDQKLCAGHRARVVLFAS
ncbi:MAG TPA: type II toxin-antitoxin system VapC family toxin [Bryobacteraceae bacterium]|nr:type II toxin-antitoxin system VapC family toxin [Bryobacteraceae bacterium]